MESRQDYLVKQVALGRDTSKVKSGFSFTDAEGRRWAKNIPFGYECVLWDIVNIHFKKEMSLVSYVGALVCLTLGNWFGRSELPVG